ncbi:unnamed protein product [Mytilus coruscus]|uniref:Endonuclease/exonuclease/phosphatase domain-containing protein n=1 Tax=Mytilus coruscus TaxID=42192 RepID=A0A6J8AAU3_MYTCO|nr:unnamed protein product [Mytilus coruscus]
MSQLIPFLCLLSFGYQLCLAKITDQQNILTKSKQGEHMFTIVNNYNPEYKNHFTIIDNIDNIRTEILSMNERRLIYREMINHLTYLSMILILISNDVNLNPGPECSNTSGTVYPCGTCDQPVTWQERGIVCDTCIQWYHISCQAMQIKSYLEHVNDSAIAWDCIMCNCPNYSTFCYSLVFSTSNQFSILSNISISSPTSGIIKPLHTSTPERKTQKKKEQEDSNPKTIRVLNVNFQSIRNKQGELINLIESTKPDIIFGTETWLDSSIKDSQYFPDGYNIYRNYRNLSRGGVLIAVKDTFMTSSVPELQTDCEIVWCKMEIVGHKTVYLSSYYNPKTSNEKGYNEYGISIERASKIRNAFIISAGDFNLPFWDWTNKEIKMHTQCATNHEQFGDILDDNGMAQLINKPTRRPNTLDLVVTNHPESFMRVETLPGLSDHEIIFKS